jgi:DNA-binding NarL/FixJ family response regulator
MTHQGTEHQETRSTLKRRIRVVLADDHVMVREALARILENSGRISVVGEAADGPEVLNVVSQSNVDCVVLDYSMPTMDAPQVIQALLRRQRRIKILVLTVHENMHYAVKALQSGAHGYLIKSAAVEELVEAIRAVDAGQLFVSPKISHEVLQHLRQPKRNRDGLESLSQREFDVLRVLGAGGSIQECARRMKISTSTASTYRARIMEKLNLQTTAELIRFALENQIVD